MSFDIQQIHIIPLIYNTHTLHALTNMRKRVTVYKEPLYYVNLMNYDNYVYYMKDRSFFSP